MFRRTFLMSMMLACVFAVSLRAADFDNSGAEKLGFKLSLQAWTNNKKSLYETLELAQQIGVNYLEMYAGQRLEPNSDAKTGPGMSDEQIKAALEKAKSCNVKILTCGVIGIPGNEDGARKVFDWAKKMGLEYLNSEPDPKALPMIDKLAGEYGITVGIHDHPKPSKYWNPDFVAEKTEGLKHVGFCADTGHWKRSGLDPVAVLKQYGPRVVSSHFKDLKPGGGHHGLHDVVWGTGESDAVAQLAALKAAGFKGPVSMEYEWKWSPEDLRACAAFFYAETNKLAGK
ncbi:sugar phosphate isomerase/epimerase [Planctomycetales bacterium ZRK34]|nr:sugar phosphate isomerase/epimerase [Planctomycetales bacterium ZRK34]